MSGEQAFPEQNAEAFDFRMTDLEERLVGPGGVELREEIAVKLADKAKQIHALKEAGMQPDDYQKASAAMTALAAAYEVIVHFPAGQRKDNE